MVLGPDAPGLALVAPGAESRKVGGLCLAPAERAEEVVDREDSEALGMLCQLMAAAIDRVSRDAERDRLLSLLRERERRLEAIVARLFSAQEDERRRVSRELHDGVAQSAGALFRQIEAQKTGASPEAVARLAGMAKGLLRELRSAIADMRPTALDDLGLAAAVTSLANSLSAKGFALELIVRGPERWPSMLESAFFRVAQEALNNVIKHACGPCLVRVVLHGEPEKGCWRLLVRDWGAGFRQGHASADPGDHIGLEVMRERMIAVGGRLDIACPPDGGVEICASLETLP